MTKFIKSNIKSLSKIAFALVIVNGSMSANALPSDLKQPIRLLSDKATYRESTGITTYSGNVSITQGTLKVQADDIRLELSKDRRINIAIAKGHPAKMEQVIDRTKGKAKGQANSIEYNNQTGIITLLGNAKLTQNGASFSGNKIRYSLKAGDVEATGSKKQRVELIFPPHNLKN